MKAQLKIIMMLTILAGCGNSADDLGKEMGELKCQLLDEYEKIANGNKNNNDMEGSMDTLLQQQMVFTANAPKLSAIAEKFKKLSDEDKKAFWKSEEEACPKSHKRDLATAESDGQTAAINRCTIDRINQIPLTEREDFEKTLLESAQSSLRLKETQYNQPMNPALLKAYEQQLATTKCE